MDYIFKDWEKKMSAFESCVEKDLAEIRKCKADTVIMCATGTVSYCRNRRSS